MNNIKKLEDDRGRTRKDIVKEIVKFSSSKRNSKNDKAKSSLTEGEECKEVERICGVQLDMTTSRDGTITIIIKGSTEKVKEARRELVMRLGQVEKTELEVPRSFAGYVIGTGRKQLNKLEETSNTKITVRNDQAGNTVFTIRGEPVNMREARNLIHAIVSDHRDRVTKNVTIPRHLEMFVFGANKEKLDEWRAEYGVYIKMEREGLAITGRNDRVLSLCREIEEMCRMRKEDSQSMQLNVERRRFNQLISDKRTLNELLSDLMSETSIAASLGDGYFVLTGKVEKMGEALSFILTKINSHVFEDLEIPSWIYRHLKKKILLRHSYQNGVLTLDGPPDVIQDALSELGEAMAEISSKYSHVTVVVNHKHHSRLVGRKGVKVRDICNTFNVEMNFPGSNIDEVYLEGSPSAVEAAKKHILQFVEDIENETTVEVMVYRHLHDHIREDSETSDILRSLNVQAFYEDRDVLVLKGNSSSVSECANVITRLADQLSRVYGRDVFDFSPPLLEELKANKCKHITTICDTTGCRIRISNSQLIVTGKREDVKHAIKKLGDLRDYNNSGEKLTIGVPIWRALVHNGVVDDLSKRFGVKMEIHGNDCFIRGHSGVVQCKKELTRLLEKDDCKCVSYTSPILKSAHYQKEIKKIGDQFGVFISHGDMTVVGKNSQKAVEAINKIASGTTTSKLVPVDERACNHIFNVRPVLKDRLEEKCGVVVERKSKKEVEILAPREEELATAVEYLKVTVDAFNTPTQITMPMEKQQIGEIIGPYGSRVRSLEDKFAVKIDILNKIDPPKITIRGSPEDVEEAKSEILNRMPVTETVHVDSFLHSHMIGTGGSRVSEIRDRFNVAIKFDSPSDTVIVTGSQKNVELAANHLKERVKQLLKEKTERETNNYSKTISISSSYVGRIIGKRGSNIANLRKKFSVNMSLDDKEGEDCQLVIVGSEENVERAFGHVSKMVESMESEVDVSISVPVSVHPILIGKGGRRIKEIMSKYNVNISFSKTVDSLVKIVGSAENAGECANYIESIVDENINSYSSFTSKSASLADYL